MGVPATSAPTGALSAGSYAFQATYSGDPNYHVSTGPCTAFTVAPTAAPTATSVQDASTLQTWAGTEITGAAALDTATVTGVSGFTPSGTVSYALYAGSACSGTVLAQSSGALSGGTVANSASSAALAAGPYSFQATYSGDANYTLTNASCEPFTVAPATPTMSTTSVENASTNQPWTQSQPLGSTATASATITGLAGFPPTGTVTFTLYTDGTCDSNQLHAVERHRVDRRRGSVQPDQPARRRDLQLPRRLPGRRQLPACRRLLPALHGGAGRLVHDDSGPGRHQRPSPALDGQGSPRRHRRRHGHGRQSQWLYRRRHRQVRVLR